MIYAWKAKYSGLDVSEAPRLRSLEDENSQSEATGGGSRRGDRKRRPQLAEREEGRQLASRIEPTSTGCAACWGLQYCVLVIDRGDRMSLCERSWCGRPERSPLWISEIPSVSVEREGERVIHKRLWQVYREAGLYLSGGNADTAYVLGHPGQR